MKTTIEIPESKIRELRNDILVVLNNNKDIRAGSGCIWGGVFEEDFMKVVNELVAFILQVKAIELNQAPCKHFVMVDGEEFCTDKASYIEDLHEEISFPADKFCTFCGRYKALEESK